MNVKTLARYAMKRCALLSTFDINSWIDEDGYPKDYTVGNGHICNTAKIPAGTVKQSLYMASGRNIYMGLLDCDPGVGNDEIELDIEYCFDTQTLVLNYNNITLQESYEDWEDDTEDNVQIHDALFYSESEYFQNSLIEEPMFEYHEHVMMINFFNEIRKRFFEKKVPIR